MLAYVFATEADANTAVPQIEAAMRGILASVGFTIDEDGHLVGKRASTGEDRPDAQHTEKWGDPFILTDGKWAIASYRENFSREVEGVPLWQNIDAAITVAFNHKDVSDLIPIPPEYPED